MRTNRLIDYRSKLTSKLDLKARKSPVSSMVASLSVIVVILDWETTAPVPSPNRFLNKRRASRAEVFLAQDVLVSRMTRPLNSGKFTFLRKVNLPTFVPRMS